MILNLSSIRLNKLLGDTEADNVNEILKNSTISVPLKYLNHLWRPFKMPFINCKVELKIKWTKYCVLSVAGNENNINNDGNTNIIFTINGIKLFVL